MEILGEYVGRDGRPRQLRVSCEAPDDADPLRGLLSGVARMRELVAQLLDPQVRRDAQDRPAAAPGKAGDGDNEDDAEDENNIDYRTNSDGSSAKRPKTSFSQ